MNNGLLVRTVLILLLLVLFFGGVYFAASFLKPLALAFLFALVVLPVSRKLEKKGISRVWSTTLSLSVVIIFIALIIALIAYQTKQMSEDSEELEKKGKEKIEQVTTMIENNTGLTAEDIESFFKQNKNGQLQSIAKSIATGILISLTDLLLMFVYIFLFLYYRQHLKEFIMRATANEERNKVKKTMEESGEIALQYLGGRFILIGILAVVYSAGLLLLGVKFAIFYGILAALLSLIPYIGNMIGATLPLLMAFIYNDTTIALGVIGLFTLTQFLESYILEPLVVGKKVHLNPMMTILVAVLGGALWGIPGMIIAIPYLGIALIIFEKIDPLKPYAFLLRKVD